jgi:Flp pilus assembly protein TadG
MPVPARPRGSSPADAGYVLALTTLLLLPLLAFVGFAVDLGAWHARAAQLQGVAEAAALAGVTRLPSEAAARTEVLEVAARNGVRR